MKILNIIKNFDVLFDELKPIASMFGFERIANMADAALEVAKIGLERVEEGQEVWSSDDVDYVKGFVDRLQKENDELNQQIRNS